MRCAWSQPPRRDLCAGNGEDLPAVIAQELHPPAKWHSPKAPYLLHTALAITLLAHPSTVHGSPRFTPVEGVNPPVPGRGGARRGRKGQRIFKHTLFDLRVVGYLTRRTHWGTASSRHAEVESNVFYSCQYRIECRIARTLSEPVNCKREIIKCQRVSKRLRRLWFCIQSAWGVSVSRGRCTRCVSRKAQTPLPPPSISPCGYPLPNCQHCQHRQHQLRALVCAVKG